MNAFGKTICLVFLLLQEYQVWAQQPERSEKDSLNIWTVYAIPTLYPLDWSSPSSLYKTMFHCYVRTLSTESNYLLGHMVVRLHSPIISEDRYLAMTSSDKNERINLVLKEKVGLAILGADLKGCMEDEGQIRKMLEVYALRGKLAFIEFVVSEQAMRRMLEFVERFRSKLPDRIQPCSHYGGIFWPLYEDEGAGCSAFAMGMLASANLLPAVSDRWLMRVNVPMRLIGGAYNHNRHIPFSRIIASHHWSNDGGEPNVDFVRVRTYDPSLLFQWIMDRRCESDSIYVPVEQGNVPGLRTDVSSSALPVDKPFFVHRSEPNLFMEVYQTNNKTYVTQPTP